MNSFAFALPDPTRQELALWIEAIVLFYVLLVCFIRVAAYVTDRYRTGKLVNTINAPLPIRLPSLSGWLFILSVLMLLYLQSVLFFLVVPAAITLVLLESGRTAGEQFGLGRLHLSRLCKWILVVYGAILFVEIPLNQLVEIAFDAFNLPQPEQETVVAFRHFNKASQILLFMLQAVVISPLLEELFFRGFLQTFLKNHTSTWLAIVLSSGVFAFAHVNLGSTVQLWFLGLVLGIAYEHTGALTLPIGIHSLFNFATALTLLIERGMS